MNEVARREALSADSSRASFIANISHELRSPLHGILGSIEFLQDTSLDDFQSAMATAVETCGKTLLDTVDHVLEYAKINHLTKNLSKGGKKEKNSQDRSIDKQKRQGDSALATDFDLATVVEEVVEAVYAGQTFRTAGSIDKTESPLHGIQQPKRESTEHIRTQIQRGSSKFSGTVRLTLDIEQRKSWTVHGEPGAIRRILTNVLGNALKYTDKGTIKVSLQCCGTSKSKASNDNFCISVVDTGRGMSSNFLHNHAFTAFTQESRVSDGAGLGLSIVCQLVNVLGGRIEVASEQNVGTEVKIRFSLMTATPDAIAVDGDVHDDPLQLVTHKTRGMSLCMLNPQSCDKRNMSELEQMQDSSLAVESVFIDLAKRWFGLRTMRSKSMDGVSADFFIYVEPPPIEYLLEEHGVHAKDTEAPVIILASNAFESASLVASGIHHLTDLGRIVEIIAQPYVH